MSKGIERLVRSYSELGWFLMLRRLPEDRKFIPLTDHERLFVNDFQSLRSRHSHIERLSGGIGRGVDLADAHNEFVNTLTQVKHLELKFFKEKRMWGIGITESGLEWLTDMRTRTPQMDELPMTEPLYALAVIDTDGQPSGSPSSAM